MSLLRDRPRFEADQLTAAARSIFGLDGAVEELASERDQTVRLRADDGCDHLLKVINRRVPRATVDLQARALEHIARTDPALSVPRLVSTRRAMPFGQLADRHGVSHFLLAFRWLPGYPLDGEEESPALRRSAGTICARLDRALCGFFHQAARDPFTWDLRRIATLASEVDAIEDRETRRMVSGVIDRFAEGGRSPLDGLPSQVIHHDANRHNLLLAAPRARTVSAIVDFGDLTHAARVVELAIAAASLCRGAPDPIAAICDVLIGYDAVSALEDEELEILPDLVLGRLAMAITIAATRAAGAPGEQAYRDGHSGSGRAAEALSVLLSAGTERMRGALRTVCRSPEPAGNGEGPALDALLARRRRALGTRLRLSYPDDPLLLTRGEDVWLYDAAGRRYLDAYNNVPHVGHSHPRVAHAIARQASRLSTNTRYLLPNVVEYAERLGGLSADGLDACMFLNSGSEANDLAWQMARLVTARDGALVMEHAYHGISLATRALSPGRDGEQAAPHVATLIAPDPYRGRFRDGAPRLCERYVDDALRALEALERAGHPPAALIVDCGFCSNGIPSVPDGYLAAVCSLVRARGALVIVDEVQVGLGRTGTHFWGYETHGIVPDIVTAGKPLGNGFPIGAVITRPAIRDALSAFSTFGGNPVACAAGLATLDVIADENLVVRARETGEYLRAGVRALAARHPSLGDVRGRGLIVGVELVQDAIARTAAPALARGVVNGLRARGVLTGRTGPERNVLKIRPPLTFTTAHADLLLDALDNTLCELGRGDACVEHATRRASRQ